MVTVKLHFMLIHLKRLMYRSVGFRESGVREEYELYGETRIAIEMVIHNE